MTLPEIATAYDADHVYHRRIDGDQLPNQPNSTFAHLEAFSPSCTFCLGQRSVRCLEQAHGRCQGLASPAVICTCGCHGV